jgi:large subunit ribosomal protein L3
MIRGLLAKKVGMTQIFDKDGNVVPITVLEAGPCRVLELKDTPVKVKLGFGEVKENKLDKAQQGFFKKIGVSPMSVVKEFKSTDNSEYQVGQEIKADFFQPGDYVDVTGTSIGKGFQGGMKRWHWDGGPASHGSRHHRRVGSIGASADPAKTERGRNMPGHMGNKQSTVQGLRVMDVDAEKNILLIKGAVPGSKNGYLAVNKSQKRAFRALDEKKVVVEHKLNPMKQSKKGK